MSEPEAPCPGPLPDATAAWDAEWAEYVAWLDREAAVGREPEPETCDPDGEEPWIPEDADLADPGRVGPVPFGPVPANELAGVLRASRRLVAREQYKQVLAAAEFGRRRRAAFAAALARGVPAGCAAGGFPGEELAIELVTTRAEAGHLIDDAIDPTTRLPRTLAGMASGLIDADRAGWIAMYTRNLSAADTGWVDAFLAGEAPELRVEQVARKASALEKKLSPGAARARKEHGQAGAAGGGPPEASGNACLAGRELDTADVLASKAYLDAIAARLHESGMEGSLDRLRALALTDLTQGRNPMNRIQSAPARPACRSRHRLPRLPPRRPPRPVAQARAARTTAAPPARTPRDPSPP